MVSSKRKATTASTALQEAITITLQVKNTPFQADLVQPIANQTTEPVSKTQLLLAIAQRYTELNQSQKAVSYLAQAFRVAQTVPGDESQFDRLGPDGGTVIPLETDRGSLLEAIAIQYARVNRMSEAMKVANTLKEKATRDEAIQKARCARTTAIHS